MMRSLWSGVSGLNAHQTGIDVEGNNIANVNTVGYKSSRTNFEDYMSQTSSPAISPQGKLGGKNATQIGSGATVANVQQLFTQGATQGTDNSTDMAINGEGFFIVTGNGGSSYEYTRAGNFTFDTNGNLTNPNGLIVQGWLADKNYEINSTGGLSNITIDPGLTTPANATTKINIVANLNSGISLGESERSPAQTTVTPTSDFNSLFNYQGNEINLKSNVDTLNLILKRTFDVNGVETESTSTHVFTYGESASDSDGFFTTVQDLLNEINLKIADSTGIHDNKVVLTGDGQIAAAGHIVAVNGSTNPQTAASTADMNALRTYDGKDASLSTGQQIQITFDSSTGITTPQTYTYGTDFTSINDLINQISTTATLSTAAGTADLGAIADTGGNNASITTGQQVTVVFDSTSGATGTATLTYGTDFTTIDDLVTAINAAAVTAGATTGSLTYNSTTGTISDSGILTSADAFDSTGAAPTAATQLSFFDSMLASLTGNGTSSTSFNDTSAGGTIQGVSYNSESGFIKDLNGVIKNAVALDSTGSTSTAGTSLGEFNYILSSLGGTDTHSYTIRGTTFYSEPTTNSILTDTLQKSTEGFFLSRSFKAVENSFIGADDMGEMFNTDGDAIMLEAGQGISFGVEHLGEMRNFVYRDPANTNKNSYLSNNFQDPTDVTIATEAQGFRWLKNSAGEDAFMRVGEKISVSFDSSTGLTTKDYTYGTTDGFQTIEELLIQVNKDLSNANPSASASKNVTFDSINGWIEDTGNVLTGMSVVDTNGNAPTSGTPLDRLNQMLSTIDGTVNSHTEVLKKNDTHYFTNMQELINLYQDAIDDAASPTNYEVSIDGTVSMNDEGKLVMTNDGSASFAVMTEAYPNDIDTNKLFFNSLSAFDTTISNSSNAISQRFFAASHATSIEVFDSSGSKIQVTLNFRKEHTSSNNNEPSTWKWYAEAPEPATFEYPSFGEVQFNLDGSVKSYSPPSMTLNANTGASSGQSIQMNLGDINGFNGLTSFADDSITKNQSQDGYTGGTLKDLSVDQTGTIIGGFSNGKTFKLAQVGLAVFANNEGLVKNGGNLYSESSNSGTAQIGTAGTSNRGSISPQSLEMSNVDLSQSLTNLIVIQRGFQANSKTITTSDQMLNTLLQLKQ